MKPNFLVVGAQKGGSTTLYHFLKQHPEIFMPDIKEPLYFIKDILKSISKDDLGFKRERNKERLIDSKLAYLKLFENVSNELAIGESSASYLYYFKHCIPQIKKDLGDPKIIIILRDPVHKVYSQYKHLRREHAEKISFEEGLRLEDKRISDNYTAMYHYKSQGLYYNQVKAYFDNFSNVLVVFNDELKNDPLNLATQCYKFLNVDPSFIPETKNYNMSTLLVKNLHLHNLLYNKSAFKLKGFFQEIIGKRGYDIFKNRYRKYNIQKMNLSIGHDTEVELREFFKEDIQKLEVLLKKDLSKWKQC